MPAKIEGEGKSRGQSTMQNTQYADAAVLLLDRRQAVRKQTRSVLNVLGFKTFLKFGDLAEARIALNNLRVDLIILDLGGEDCGALGLVGDVRGRRLGLDPFVPILLTTWDAKLKALRPVMSSGADDVLLFPFSTAQMGQRIEALVRHRKPFVISEDYFGPDRRGTTELEKDTTSITVPNALRARVEGRPDAAPNAARIEETLIELRRLKLRNVARRIWYLADKLKSALSDPSLPDRYERELTTLQTSISIYNKTLIPGDSVDLNALCDALSGVLAGLFGRPPVQKGLELLEKNALALRVASKLDREPDELVAAISDEVAKVGKIQAELVRTVLG
ncbi:MAG: hypothetical protein VCD66_06670 [Alphaproteobacteria bacterium]